MASLLGQPLLTGGDVQVEGGAVVDVDELTHWRVDIYDNAMFVIALKNMKEFALETKDKQRWDNLYEKIKT